MLKIEEVLPHFNNSRVQLASALGITKQAVSGWTDGVLPVLREKEVRYELLPHIFGPKQLQGTNGLLFMESPNGGQEVTKC